MTLEEIAGNIKSNTTTKLVLIGIEGFGGSGKSTIANQISGMLTNSYVISIDDFIVKEHILEDDWDKRAFDRSRLESEVLVPFKADREVIYHKLEWATDTLSEPIRVPDTTYLIVEGISCYHPSICQYYDVKVWVDTPIETAKARGKNRDSGNENAEHWDLWAENDLQYQQKYHPELEADYIVKN